MNEKDLKSIKLINLEIKRIQCVLNGFNNTRNKSALREEYARLLHSREDELIKKKLEAEQFIKDIDEAEIRLILTLRFIDLKSWNYISKKLHYDRSTLLKKIKKFFETNQNNIHKTQHLKDV